MATRDIQPGDHILEIPRRLILHSGKGGNYFFPSTASPALPKLNLADKFINKQGMVAFNLALERKLQQKSKLWPYLQILPRDFNTIPLNYAPELDLLPTPIKGNSPPP